jgi:hypothetical protein
MKADHQKLVGELQPLILQGWKWENISMDFVLGLTRSDRWNDAI